MPLKYKLVKKISKQNIINISNQNDVTAPTDLAYVHWSTIISLSLLIMINSTNLKCHCLDNQVFTISLSHIHIQNCSSHIYWWSSILIHILWVCNLYEIQSIHTSELSKNHPKQGLRIAIGYIRIIKLDVPSILNSYSCNKLNIWVLDTASP